jgi:hypothetical protein
MLLDDANKVLAFARSLPGDEVILLMNYGATKREVTLPAGRPGQLVVVLSPNLRPHDATRGAKGKPPEVDHTKTVPLHTGASRQFVDAQGTLRLWVNPRSIRVVLVNDKEPR